MVNTIKDVNIRILKYIIPMVLLCIIGIVVYIYDYQSEQEQNQLEQAHRVHEAYLTYAAESYDQITDDIRSELLSISNNPLVADYALTQTAQSQKNLTEFMRHIAGNEQYYSQMRFVAANGLEKIRVYNHGDHTEIAPSTNLEDKSKKPYFSYAQSIRVKEIGQWKPEKTLKRDNNVSVLRLLTPVEVDGVRKGYLVLNVDILEILTDIQKDTESGELMAILPSDKNQVISQIGRKFTSSTFAHIKDQPSIMIENSEPTTNVHSVLYEDRLYSFYELKDRVDSNFGHSIVISSDFIHSPKTYTNANYVFKLFAVAAFCLLATSYFVRVVLNYESRTFSDQLTEAAINGVAGVMITDMDWVIQNVNLEFSRLTGRHESEVVGTSIFNLNLQLNESQLDEIRPIIRERGIWRGEISGISKFGGRYTILARVQAIHNVMWSKTNYVITFHDISERKRLEERLTVLSEKDALTGVYNRRKFDEELSSASQLVRRYADTQNSLALIDIDHFKQINDKHGHDGGDRILQAVASFLKEQCRETDRVYRVGGEEFAIIMPHTHAEQAKRTLERIKSRCENIDNEILITFSAGISAIGEHARHAYRQADSALYEAKRNGRDRVFHFASISVPTKEKLYAVE